MNGIEQPSIVLYGTSKYCIVNWRKETKKKRGERKERNRPSPTNREIHLLVRKERANVRVEVSK